MDTEAAPQPRHHHLDIIGSVLLFAVLIVTSVLSMSAIFFQSMAVDNCSGRNCNFGLAESAGWLSIAVGLIVPAIAGISIFFVRWPLKNKWRVPLVAIGITIVSYITNVSLLGIAYGHST